MRIEVRAEKVGERYSCVVKGREGSKRASTRTDAVALKDVAATLKSLLDVVEEKLTPNEA